MLIKIVLILMLLLIIGQLFHALWLMMTTGQTQKMSAPLGRRVLFSLLVVVIAALPGDGLAGAQPTPLLRVGPAK